MARPERNGWDFVRVGKVYQYKEEWGIGRALIAMVEILEDTSDDKYYNFKIRPLKGTMELAEIGPEPFEVSHAKNIGGIYSGMPQFYEEPEYTILPLGTPWPIDYARIDQQGEKEKSEDEKDNA